MKPLRSRYDWLFLLVVAVFVISTAVTVWPNLHRSPQIQIDSNEIDFGAIQANSVASRKVEIFNAGSGDLVIESVRASCGCVAGHVSSNVIAGGKSATLTISVEPKTFPKRQSFDLLIACNDPVNELVNCKILYSIWTDRVETSPTTLDFGSTSYEMLPTSRTLVVTTPSADQTNPPTISSEDPYVATDIRKGTEGTWFVVVTRSKDSPIGEFDGELEINFEDSNDAKISTCFFGNVRGEFYATPGTLSLTAPVTNEQQLAVRVTIKSRSPDSLAVRIHQVQASKSISKLVNVRINKEDPSAITVYLVQSKLINQQNRQVLGNVIITLSKNTSGVVKNRISIPVKISVGSKTLSAM